MATFFQFIKERKWPRFGEQTPRRFVTLTSLFALLGAAFFYAALWKLSLQHSYVRPINGGTFTEGVIGAPRFINPLLAANATDEELVSLLYSGLAKENSDGTIAPDLATYSVSPDGTQYTFTLLPNAKFSDNKPLTTDDVIFTYSLVQQGLGPTALGAEVHQMTFQKIDDHTVSITIPANDPEALHALTLGILPAHVWQGIDPAAFQNAPEELKPVGDGPFKLARIVSKNGVPVSITLNRNPRAFTKPFLQKYTLDIFSNDDTLTQALEDGTLDMTRDVSALPFKITDPGSDYAIRVATTPVTLGIYTQNSNTILSDSKFRSAFFNAIDKASLIATIENGYGTPEQSLPNANSSPSSTTFDDLVAQKVLTRQNGTLLRQGVPIDIALTVESGSKENDIANAIRETMAPLGITVDVRAYDSGMFRSLINAGQASTIVTTNTLAPNAYSLSVPLYTRAQPVIIRKDLSLFADKTLMLSNLYANADVWYVREERVWNLFKHFTTNN